jgi:hypothetical protein
MSGSERSNRSVRPAFVPQATATRYGWTRHASFALGPTPSDDDPLPDRWCRCSAAYSPHGAGTDDDYELKEVQRTIAAHPGHQEHLKLQALERSIGDVFIPNRNLLLSLLEGASTKWQLAFELIQNVRPPVVRAAPG